MKQKKKDQDEEPQAPTFDSDDASGSTRPDDSESVEDITAEDMPEAVIEEDLSPEDMAKIVDAAAPEEQVKTAKASKKTAKKRKSEKSTKRKSSKSKDKAGKRGSSSVDASEHSMGVDGTLEDSCQSLSTAKSGLESSFASLGCSATSFGVVESCDASISSKKKAKKSKKKSRKSAEKGLKQDPSDLAEASEKTSEKQSSELSAKDGKKDKDKPKKSKRKSKSEKSKRKSASDKAVGMHSISPSLDESTRQNETSPDDLDRPHIVERMQALIEEQGAECQRLRRALDKANRKENEDLVAAQEANEGLKAGLATVKEEMASIVNEYEEDLTETEVRTKNLEKELAGERQQIAKTRERLEIETAEKRRLQKTLEDSIQTGENAADVESFKASLEAELAADRQQICDLKKIIDSQATENQRLQKEFEESVEQRKDAVKQNSELKDNLLKLSTELSEVSVSSSKFSIEVHELRTKLLEKEEALQESKIRISKLECVVERQLDCQDDLEAKLESADDEIDKMESDIEELEEQNLELSKQMEDLNTKSQGVHEMNKKLDDQSYQLEEKRARIEVLERDYVEKLELIQRLEIITEENMILKGKLDEAGEASNAETTCFLQKELNVCRSEIDSTKGILDAAQSRVEALEREKDGLNASNEELQRLAKSEERKASESAEKTREMQERITHWTEKTYEWKLRAEMAEKKIETLNADGTSGPSSDSAGSEADETPQALFLQAAMDRIKTGPTTQGQRRKWGIGGVFAGNRKDDDEEETDDACTAALEERNASLEATIAQVQSELVKLQTKYKEEAYNNKKRLELIQSENDAYGLKNAALVKLCGEIHFAESSDEIVCKDAGSADIHQPCQPVC